MFVVGEVTQMNDAMDFIEFISQDLPWDDIDLGDESDPVRPVVTCSPAEHEFHPDDLSLFSAFASSLPSLDPQADCDTDIKAIHSSIGRIEGDVADGTGADPAQDVVADLDCFDGVGLSSEMEDIMADILDGCVDEKLASCGETEQVRKESCGHSTMQPASNDAFSVAEKSKLTCNMKSSNERFRMTLTTSERAKNEESRAVLCRGEMVPDTSSLSEQSEAEGERECEALCDKGLDWTDNGRQESIASNTADDDDDDDVTDSQRWVRDQLQTHLRQQHDEASRINSLRDLLPPAAPSVASRDPINRAMHVFTTQVQVMKLDTQLISAVLASNPNTSQCCQLLREYSPYELSPRVLVQYPFFAGTVDLCCRWAGPQADELRDAAHRLRAFMMAMYARDSVDEGFLTALNRQVSACRRAMAANTADLTRLTRKHRELAGLAEFYSCRYSDWDTFMTQFYDPNHQPLSVTTERRNTSRRMQANVRPMKSGSSCLLSDRAANTTDKDNVVRASASNQPTVASGGECASATVADIVTTRPQSKVAQSVTQFSGHTCDIERTSEVSPALRTRRQSGRLSNAAVPDTQPLLDADTKPVLDETVRQTARSGRRKRAVDEAGCVESPVEGVKPAAGLLAKQRQRVGGRRNISRNRLEMDHASSTADGDCKRRQIKRDVGTVSVESDVNPENGVTGRLLARRDVVDNDEVQDFKPVIGTVTTRRKERKSKRARQAENKPTGPKNSVDVVGEISWTGFEEQDVKPDLSSVDVKRGDGVTVMRRRGHPRKECEDTRPADTTGRSRKGRRPKKSRRSKTSLMNSFELAGEVALTGFEEQDVKPDLASLGVAAERKARRRSKRKWSLCPGVETRSMRRLRQMMMSVAQLRPADSHASPARRPQSPPFTFLSPSQIKVEVES